MAKEKSQKTANGVQNPLHSRILYLHNASSYIQSMAPGEPVSDSQAQKDNHQSPSLQNKVTQNYIHKPYKKAVGPGKEQPILNLCRLYNSQMRAVSLKSQRRLPPEIKRSMCKRCDTSLIPDITCTESVENNSKGRKKPWADVSVVHCNTCGTKKRYPQNPRNPKLSQRRQQHRVNKGDDATGFNKLVKRADIVK